MNRSTKEPVSQTVEQAGCPHGFDFKACYECTPTTAEEAGFSAEELAAEQATKDAALMAQLQSKLQRFIVRGKPNRAQRRMAVRHAGRTWTGPMTDRAKRERRALARKGVLVVAEGEAVI